MDTPLPSSLLIVVPGANPETGKAVMAYVIDGEYSPRNPKAPKLFGSRSDHPVSDCQVWLKSHGREGISICWL